jgi:hypothetical protein
MNPLVKHALLYGCRIALSGFRLALSQSEDTSEYALLAEMLKRYAHIPLAQGPV